MTAQTETKSKSEKAAKANDVMGKNIAAAAGELDVQWGNDVSDPDIHGFWKEDLQKVVVGQIIGYKVIPSKTKRRKDAEVVILKLLAPAVARIKVEGRATDVSLNVGENIAVTIKAKSTPLLEYVEHRCTVRIEALEKIDIGDGNTMWKYRIQPAKGSKIGAPPKPIVHASSNSDDIDDDDVDFP